MYVMVSWLYRSNGVQNLESISALSSLYLPQADLIIALAGKPNLGDGPLLLQDSNFYPIC